MRTLRSRDGIVSSCTDGKVGVRPARDVTDIPIFAAQDRSDYVIYFAPDAGHRARFLLAAIMPGFDAASGMRERHEILARLCVGAVAPDRDRFNGGSVAPPWQDGRAVAHVQYAKDGKQMNLYRSFGYAEFARDELVGHALAKQTQYVDLAPVRPSRSSSPPLTAVGGSRPAALTRRGGTYVPPARISRTALTMTFDESDFRNESTDTEAKKLGDHSRVLVRRYYSHRQLRHAFADRPYRRRTLDTRHVQIHQQ